MALGALSCTPAATPPPTEPAGETAPESPGESGAGESEPALALVAGPASACAIDSTGVPWCWGRFATKQGTRDGAMPFPGITDAVDISVGARFACVLHADGGVSCWGANERNQCGFPSEDDGVDDGRDEIAEPTRVPGLMGLQSIESGASHSCGIDTFGGVVCWGSLQSGALGGDSYEPEPPWPRPSGLDNIVELSLTTGTSCALDREGAVYCWGSRWGGLWSAEPKRVEGIGRALEISTGSNGHSCARTEDEVVCWGSNENSQLGVEPPDPNTPVAVVGLPPAKRMLAPGANVCVVSEQDELWCRGSTWSKDREPVKLEGPAVESVVMGNAYACWLGEGEVLCMGDNEFNQLAAPGVKESMGKGLKVQGLDQAFGR